MRKSCSGFTLIEVLVVVSIITFLFSLGIAYYIQFNRRQIVVQAALNVKNSLRMAQNKASSGEKTCSGVLDGYEFYFGSTGGKYTCGYRSKCGTNYGQYVTSELPSPVIISSFPTPNPILFKVLGQGTNIAGSTSIVLQGFNDSDNTQTITITNVGEIK